MLINTTNDLDGSHAHGPLQWHSWESPALESEAHRRGKAIRRQACLAREL